MRFDLTNASYRVFQRADKLRLQPGMSVIDAAKVLLALFDEEESRAADWLNEKELTADDFRSAVLSGAAENDNEEPAPPLTEYPAPKPPPSVLRFYLDDVHVDAGKLTPEFQSALEIVAHRFAQTDRRKTDIPTGVISTAGGGVKTIAAAALRFTVATEHLLLAAVLDDGKTGQYLRDKGFDAAGLYQRIETLSGVNPVPAAEENSAGTAAVQIAVDGGSVPVLRIIDAAANRSREAVRVLEDYARFILGDAALTRQLKEFRHALQTALNIFPLPERLAVRNTESDVGTDIETADEYDRQTLDDILSANFSRLQESLRSLEEFAKLTQPLTAKVFEQLRYRSYTIQMLPVPVKQVKQAEMTVPDNTGAASLTSLPQLYVLLDCRSSEAEFASLAKQLVDGGVNIIQLRDKTADERTLLSRSRILREIIGEKDVLFMMNDRPDLAVLAQADGVHVGQDELPAAAVRQIVGSRMFVGVSTHNIVQARQAVADGADYIGAGPVFESATKEFSEPAGLEFLREIAAEIALPAFAIGGITLSNAEEVLSTGIMRLAVSSAVIESENPQETAEAFQRIFEKNGEKR
ncbi:MAG: thiamine phosphate synthase [Planctomycetaceae bacterium]|jgi:thiamine-phosphate pyrophosphorylase|nr:thiamine phosphate synthase [Planctomycetaceae bacterium]